MITDIQKKLLVLYVLNKLETSMNPTALIAVVWEIPEIPPIITESTISALEEIGDVEVVDQMGMHNVFITDKGRRHLSILLDDEIPKGKQRAIDEIVRNVLGGISNIYHVKKIIEPIDEESYTVEARYMELDIEHLSIKVRAKDLDDANDFLNYLERNAEKIKNKIVKEEDL